MHFEDEDLEDLEELSYSFYADNKDHSYIDSEDSIVNNYRNQAEEIGKTPSMENLMYGETPPNPINYLTKRTREKWVDDSSVSKCKTCKNTFRIYRRRHHCILAGTKISLSNGMARKIEDIYPGQKLPSWNPRIRNVTNKEVDTLFDQGEEPCLRIVLEDGRELIATPDHKVLTIPAGEKEPRYIVMANLTTEDRVICSSLNNVLDHDHSHSDSHSHSHDHDHEPEQEQEPEQNYLIPEILLSFKEHREKCLAFARLSGYSINQDLEDKDKDFEDFEDLEVLTDDLEQIGDLKRFLENKRSLPKFIYDLKCPRSLQREFLAGLGEDLSNLTIDEKIRIHQILKKFGIDHINKPDLENLVTYNDEIGYRYSIKQQMKMSVTSMYLKTDRKQTFKEFLRNSDVNPNKRYLSLKIISANEIYNQGMKYQVYDLSVPENVSYIANGIIVHNCRNCCDVFCDECTKYRAKIPKVIKKIPTRTGTEEEIDYNTPVRLCLNCYTNYDTIHKLEKLLTVFSLLNLDLFDFKNLSMVCKAWRPMALFYLSKFREIQYKLPKYSYNDWEKRALWNNRHILKNHTVWEIHVLRSLRLPPKNTELQTSPAANERLQKKRELERLENQNKFNEIVKIYYNTDRDSPRFSDCSECIKDVKECWDRMCSRYCRTELDPERALLLLDVLDNQDQHVLESLNTLAKEIVNAFDTCDDYILECYLPYILSKVISSDNLVIRDWIFKRASNSIRIANCSYWFFKNNSKKYFTDLCGILPQNMFVSLLKAESFLELIRDEQDLPNELISLVNPELGLQIIDKANISIKKSATKPTFIPCSKASILFKKDDIRKDYVIICVIRLMEKILQDSGLDISIVTYNVQPTSANEGFIQIVDNCETLYSISEKLNTTLINYLLKHNPDESVQNLRNRFKNSCAVYSVIAFLLSISDRNTENLMLTTDGSMFHIDFSYVLSLDPKILRTSCVRITPQMLEALGGEKSQEYEEFKELCGTIYDILRRHVNTFVCLLSLIPTFKSNSRTSPEIDEKQMYIEIIKRFCPGENYEDAIRNLKTRIDNSADHSTLSKYHVIDFFHKHNREATMTNFLGGTISSAYNGTKSLMGGLYSYFPFT